MNVTDKNRKFMLSAWTVGVPGTIAFVVTVIAGSGYARIVVALIYGFGLAMTIPKAKVFITYDNGAYEATELFYSRQLAEEEAARILGKVQGVYGHEYDPEPIPMTVTGVKVLSIFGRSFDQASK